MQQLSAGATWLLHRLLDMLVAGDPRFTLRELEAVLQRDTFVHKCESFVSGGGPRVIFLLVADSVDDAAQAEGRGEGCEAPAGGAADAMGRQTRHLSSSLSVPSGVTAGQLPVHSSAVAAANNAVNAVTSLLDGLMFTTRVTSLVGIRQVIYAQRLDDEAPEAFGSRYISPVSGSSAAWTEPGDVVGAPKRDPRQLAAALVERVFVGVVSPNPVSAFMEVCSGVLSPLSALQHAAAVNAVREDAERAAVRSKGAAEQQLSSSSSPPELVAPARQSSNHKLVSVPEGYLMDLQAVDESAQKFTAMLDSRFAELERLTAFDAAAGALDLTEARIVVQRVTCSSSGFTKASQDVGISATVVRLFESWISAVEATKSKDLCGGYLVATTSARGTGTGGGASAQLSVTADAGGIIAAASCGATQMAAAGCGAAAKVAPRREGSNAPAAVPSATTAPPATTLAIDFHLLGESYGPLAELQAWRSFATRARSTIEQAECHEVASLWRVLELVDSELASQWLALKSELGSAVEQAEHAIKFLASTEHVFAPLYLNDPVAAGEGVADLIAAVKLLQSVVPYYSVPEHVTLLLAACSNQIILCCKESIRRVGRVWDQADSIQLLRQMLARFAATQATARAYRQECVAHGFASLPELPIFGKLELFCTRLKKLHELFDTVLTFSILSEYSLEGIESLLTQFFTNFDELRRRSGDPLDYTKPSFDRDFFEFRKKIVEADCSLQVYVNSQFECVPNTLAALEMLRRFSILMQRESIRADLQAKHLMLFQRYGTDIEAVQRAYEHHKGSPPIARNAPPVAGNILWARQLLNRITTPMRVFQESRTIAAHQRETSKIVRLYNRVALALTEFEARWTIAWRESVPKIISNALAATLLVTDFESPGRMVVNFDHAVVELLREVKWLTRIGVDLPEEAVTLAKYREFSAWSSGLAHAIRWFESCEERVPVVLRAAMQRHIEAARRAFNPGLQQVTWSSTTVPAFIRSVLAAVEELDLLVGRVVSTIDNRIHLHLRDAMRQQLVISAANVADDGPFTIDVLWQRQQSIAKAASERYGIINETLREGVEDLCRLLDGGWGPGVADSEAGQLYNHYNRQLLKTVLASVNAALHELRALVGTPMGASFVATQRPFIVVTLDVAAPHVLVSPPLEEIQDTMNRVVTSILSCTQCIGRWPHVRAAYSSSGESGSFFEEISRNKEVVCNILLLTGGVFGLRKMLDDFTRSVTRFDYLWRRDCVAVVKQFASNKKRPLEHYEEELNGCTAIANEVALTEDVCIVSCLSVDSTPAKAAIHRHILQWKQQYGKALAQAVEGRLVFLYDKVDLLLKRVLQPTPDNFSAVPEQLEALREAQYWDFASETELLPLEDICAVMEHHRIQRPSEYTDRIYELKNKWKRLRVVATDKREQISKIQHCYKQDLLMSVCKFGVEIQCFHNSYATSGPGVKGLTPAEATERLRRFQRLLDDKLRRWQLHMEAERVFGYPQHRYAELAFITREVASLDRLYTLFSRVTKRLADFSATLWKDFNLRGCIEEVQRLQEAVKHLPGAVKQWDAYALLRKKVDDFLALQPVLEQLSHPSIRERHWRDVMRIAEKSWPLDREQMKLAHLMEADLLPFADEIIDLASASEKEGDIEHRLASITREWKAKELSFAEFKHRGFITLKGDDTALLKEQLEDTLVTLGSVIASRYVAPFRAEAHSWSVKITTIAETLSLWMEVQALWMYLEAVFAGGDIMKQLPQEAKRFAMIDKQWVKIFFKAAEVCNVVDFCFGNDILKSLPYLRDQLECCQRALASYLEQKRNAFARFYFVSDTVLLEVLSQGSDPRAMQPHLSAIFDGIHHVTFDAAASPNSKKRLSVTAISSAEDETLKLVESVKCEGNIEDWLQVLCVEMQRSVRMSLREAVGEITAVRSSIQLVQKFLFAHAAQNVLTALQVSFTADVTRALGGKQTDKRELSAHLVSMKEMLAEQVRLDISQRHQTHIETLTTMAVHNQEVWELSARRNAKDAHSFEWLKQLRFYWTDRDVCVLNIADASIRYCDEYLGVKERLVITPLTDRCYVTLSQALMMYMGGAPAGPAGTGKTETVKDLGRAAGKFVVVFNCSDQWDFRSLGKIFRGLSQSGAWGCFDEFNRITLPVLSVVAQQIHTIFFALKQHRSEFVFTDGSHCKLQPGIGIFVTMNPGYAGRQELPENLKILFRGVSMMVPDRQAIMKVKLAAAGYKLDTLLARKFNMLYQMCEEQLSAQRHYDFGLRNILSVLRTAGDVLRRMGAKDEEAVFMRCVRDMNLSKLVFADVPVFLSLLEDMFPNKKPDGARYEKLEAALRSKAAETCITSTAAWIAKCVQIYETKLVRHGIMVVGPAGSGKTVCITHLLHALSVTDRRHREVRMNPKAITSQQMFGRMDVATGDWFDGVFSYLWRRYNRERTASIWLICDGPVDTLWIESLNTVLDDNKLLTLANGDRIHMSPTLKMCFEVDNLRNASPATVSRAGIIFMSLEDVGWQAVYRSAIAREVSNRAWNTGVGTLFEDLGIQNFESVFNACQTQCRLHLALSAQHLCMSLVTIASPLCEELCRQPATSQSKLVIEMVFWYALAWAIGGPLDSADRAILLSTFYRKVPKLGEHKDIYSFYVSIASGSWCPWSEAVPRWESPWDRSATAGAAINISNVFVPTVESTVLHAMLETHAKQGKPTLLVGNAGCAKTMTMQRFLAGQQTETQAWSKVSISRATTPQLAQGALEDQCEKRMGATYGPKRNKVLAMFIDDLNMADTNEWGDQAVCELLRQLIEFGGVYSLEKVGEWKHFVDLKHFAAMTIAASGGSAASASASPVTARLLRHYTVYNLPVPSPIALETIYGSIMRARFGAAEHLASVVAPAVDALLGLWRIAQTKLLPTPTRFYYSFNLRDLTRVVQGMLLAPLMTLPDVRSFGELWAHECCRVLGDKLNNPSDVSFFDVQLKEACAAAFGSSAPLEPARSLLFCNFSRDPVLDEFGEELEVPMLYEKVSFEPIQAKLQALLERHNDNKKGVKLDLVLFRVVVEHVLRIARTIGTPRGSTLIVGVGGSGKQSAARLAAYTQCHQVFQPTMTAAYCLQNWFDDLRSQYLAAAVGPVTFLVTDGDLKNDDYLEYINASLSGGDVPGLFNPEEKEQALSSIRQLAKSLAKREFEDSEEWLWGFFLERVRANLHYVICFSPQGDRLRDRVRRFPSIIAACTIDFFFPWPQEALLEVATKRISRITMTQGEKLVVSLPPLVASIHTQVQQLCEDYFVQFRRSVHTTPKVFLTFLDQFAAVYTEKSRELGALVESLQAGLRKLQDAGDDVATMRVELSKKEEALVAARQEAEVLLAEIRETTAHAESQRSEVAEVTARLMKDAAEIAAAREEAEADLLAAQPALDAARRALDAITANDIKTLKAMQRPPEMVRRIFDGVCILLQEHVDEPRAEPGKGGRWVLGDSWVSSGRQVCSRSELLEQLSAFNTGRKDQVNDETCELLLPYLQQEDFTYERAKAASGNIAGLCTWVRAMVTYREMSMFVAPKIEKLDLAENQLRRANVRLDAKKQELVRAEAELARCQQRLNDANTRKQQLEDDAMRTLNKVTYATELIKALEEERARWRIQQAEFTTTMGLLPGASLCAAAFMTYGSPFNTEFRLALLHQNLLPACTAHGVPVTANFNFVKFMVDEQCVTSWQIEGLPMDQHSIENAIFVTKGLRAPLLIDPQEQGQQWIAAHNAERSLRTVRLGDKAMMSTIESQLAQGEPLIIDDAAFGKQPILEALVDRRVLRSGRQQVISLLGDIYDFKETFSLFLVTKIPDLCFDPEVYAKVAVIDFSVTIGGLEQQLLARVIASEKNELEEQLNALIVNINRDEQLLRGLEEKLLEKLSAAEGSLIDDESLILTLTNSKNSARDVKHKIVDASEAERKIRVARDEYRSVAQRGAVLYFVAVEMASINHVYQLSLMQFKTLFEDALQRSMSSTHTQIRIRNIVDLLTSTFFTFVGRGLFDNHKLLFALLMACKIQVQSGAVSVSALRSFLRGGNAIDYDELTRQRPKAFGWLSAAQWKNLINISNEIPKLKHLAETMAHHESDWIQYLNHATPEQLPVPSIAELTPFERMFVVRSLRIDRSLAAATHYITEVLSDRFTDLPAYDLDVIVSDEVRGRTPILFLLSPGSDPTVAIEQLAKKRHKTLHAVSMGQGQEAAALAMLTHAQASGEWVIFQNCHLGIAFLSHLTSWVQAKGSSSGGGGSSTSTTTAAPRAPQGPDGAGKDHVEMRVFVTTEPARDVPVSLLQRCIKLTNEPPQGMHAAIKKTSSWVSGDSYDMFRRAEWKPLIFGLCFYHAALLERRKYGSQGWTVPYQFSEGDFHASLLFLQNHFATIGEGSRKGGAPVSWEGVRFMVGDVQYGGRVTNSDDRVTLQAMTEKILSPKLCERGAQLCPELGRFPVVETTDVLQFRALIGPMFGVQEPPQVVGLPASAEATQRTLQAELVLATILNVQPRLSAADAGDTREAAVLGIIESVSERMPPAFTPRYIADASQRLDAMRPLTIFFGLEAERLSRVISAVNAALHELRLALSGALALTPQLSAISDSLFFTQVPAAFAATSWKNKSFTVWFSSLLRRHELIKGHLASGMLPVYQLSLLFNPRGFLNSVRQEVCRRRAVDGWVLDRVETKFNVTKMTTASEVGGAPEEGAFISGLFLDGASWDLVRCRLRQAQPKEPFPAMPVIHVTAQPTSTPKPPPPLPQHHQQQQQQPPHSSVSPGATQMLGQAESTGRGIGMADTTAALAAAGTGAGAAPIPPNSLGTIFQRSRVAAKADDSLRRLTRIPCYINAERGDGSFVCGVDVYHDDPDPLSWTLRGVALLCNAE